MKILILTALLLTACGKEPVAPVDASKPSTNDAVTFTVQRTLCSTNLLGKSYSYQRDEYEDGTHTVRCVMDSKVWNQEAAGKCGVAASLPATYSIYANLTSATYLDASDIAHNNTVYAWQPGDCVTSTATATVSE